MNSTVEARKSGMVKIELCQISFPSAHGISGYEITFQCDVCLFPFFVLLAEQGAEIEGTLQPHSSELYIPKHAACHNDLAPYSELMKWVKEVDQAVFLELCQVSRDCSVSFSHTTGSCAKPPTTACPLLSSQKLKICF